MSNVDYIKNTFQSQPFIMKTMLKMQDITVVNIKYIEHINEIFKKYSDKLKKVKVAYHSYNNFMNLYYAILDITDETPVDIGFMTLSLLDKKECLKNANIKFKEVDDILIIYPQNFEETALIAPRKWCITKSRSLWNGYNKNKTHIVLIKSQEMYGVSVSNTYFRCFNSKDKAISKYKLNKIFKKNIINIIFKKHSIQNVSKKLLVMKNVNWYRTVIEWVVSFIVINSIFLMPDNSIFSIIFICGFFYFIGELFIRVTLEGILDPEKNINRIWVILFFLISHGLMADNSLYRGDTQNYIYKIIQYTPYQQDLEKQLKKSVYSKILINQFNVASENNDETKMKLLLSEDFNKSAQDEIIEKIISEDQYSILKFLIDNKKIDLSDDGEDIVETASDWGRSDIIKELLKHPDIDPSENADKSIRNAASGGHNMSVIALLTDPRVDPSAYNNEAIRYAASNGYVKTVNVLMSDSRVDPSDKNNDAIKSASENNHLDVIVLLMKDIRVDPSVNNNFVLHLFSANNDDDMIITLLKDKRVASQITLDWINIYIFNEKHKKMMLDVITIK